MPVIRDDQTLKPFETIVKDFVATDKGHFVVATEDTLFSNVLRKTVNTHLGLGHTAMTVVNTQSRITQVLREMKVRRRKIILFIERTMENVDMLEFIQSTMSSFRNIKTIVLTPETDLAHLALLHELGADNIIVKPVDVNSVIVKIAYTIKPHGKLDKLIQTAKDCLQSGAYRFALKICGDILEIQPGSPAALMIMGDAYAGLEMSDRAVSAFERACDRDELYMEPLLKLAQYFQERGDSKRQLRYLSRLDELSPLNLDRKVYMGQLFLDTGQRSEAQEIFSAAADIVLKDGARDKIEKLMARIGEVCEERDPKLAEEYYRRLFEQKGDNLGKSDVATFNRLGLSLRKQGKWKDAVIEYQKALRIAPEDENLFYNIAMAYAEGQQHQLAYENVTKALDIHPKLAEEDATASYNIGLIHHRAGKGKEAKKFVKRTLKLNPEHEAAKKRLAAILSEEKAAKEKA